MQPKAIDVLKNIILGRVCVCSFSPENNSILSEEERRSNTQQSQLRISDMDETELEAIINQGFLNNNIYSSSNYSTSRESISEEIM
jgi:hypothetical protein